MEGLEDVLEPARHLVRALLRVLQQRRARPAVDLRTLLDGNPRPFAKPNAPGELDRNPQTNSSQRRRLARGVGNGRVRGAVDWSGGVVEVVPRVLQRVCGFGAT